MGYLHFVIITIKLMFIWCIPQSNSILILALTVSKGNKIVIYGNNFKMEQLEIAII